jgi:hypothetical protein
VAALDAAGNESAHSPAVFVATPPCDPAPTAPVLTATALSASSVALSWLQDAEALSYTVYEGSKVVTTLAAPSATVTGLASRSQHTYRVVANLVDGCGATPTSTKVTVRTRAGAAARPTTPANLKAASVYPNPVVTLTWSQPASADPVAGYRVYEGGAVLATSPTPGVSLRLLPATSHQVTVTAVDPAGNESAQSTQVTFTVPFVAPA